MDIDVDIIRNEAICLFGSGYIVSSIYKTNLLAYCCTVVSFVGIIFLVLTLNHVPCQLCLTWRAGDGNPLCKQRRSINGLNRRPSRRRSSSKNLYRCSHRLRCIPLPPPFNPADNRYSCHFALVKSFYIDGIELLNYDRDGTSKLCFG